MYWVSDIRFHVRRTDVELITGAGRSANYYIYSNVQGMIEFRIRSELDGQFMSASEIISSELNRIRPFHAKINS